MDGRASPTALRCGKPQKKRIPDRSGLRQAVLCGLCVETEEKNAKFAKRNLAKFAKKEDETFYP